MRTYEYICENCNSRFDHFQGINDVPHEKCPECGGIVKRLISGGAGFLMKSNSTGKLSDNILKPSCGINQTCCGREFSCGQSNGCHE